MTLLIKPKQTVLFIGDSITDCGRLAEEAPLGGGYVRQIRDLIGAKYPGHRLTYVNKGVSGNTVRDLKDRWSDDAIRFQPDWLSILIGVNDLHRWLRRDEEGAVTPREFADMYDALLQRAKKETQAKIVLVTPFYISRDSQADSWRARALKNLPKYSKTVHALAKKYGARLVDPHRRFQKLLKHAPADQFCPEPVHPNLSGHLVIAHCWLKTMKW